MMNDGNQNTREISFHGKSLEFTMCGHVGSPWFSSFCLFEDI